MPLTGTSANRAGGEPLTLAEEVAREFGPEVDLILDAGPCPGGLPSTIVDVTVSPPRLVRPGAISNEELMEIVPDLKYRDALSNLEP
jgi:L-threonylcarbamoyladenylate synthase